MRLALLSALAGLALAGCGKNACQKYADDVTAKYQMCGIAVPPTTPNKDQTCTACEAQQSNCFDACLPKIDCGCTKDPTGAGCADKLKPYTDCITVCASCELGGGGTGGSGGGPDMEPNPFVPSTPTCVPPGTVMCPSGTTFASSPSASGCFTDPYLPAGAFNPPYDNPMGPCPSTDNVVQCNPGCSFCLTKMAKIPPGCTAI